MGSPRTCPTYSGERRYNVLDVFVATDGGPAILNATREYPQLRWHQTPQQKIDIDRVAIRRGAAFPYEEAESALIDMFLLSEAFALVGKMTSNLFRAAFELRRRASRRRMRAALYLVGRAVVLSRQRKCREGCVCRADI